MCAYSTIFTKISWKDENCNYQELLTDAKNLTQYPLCGLMLNFSAYFVMKNASLNFN